LSREEEALLKKARDSLTTAQAILDMGQPGFAVSRAYYAMFYLAQAFLETEGKSFSKHSATISGFGRFFVKTGKIPKEFHAYLIEAEKMRLAGDYNVLRDITFNEAELHVRRAAEFLDFAEEKLKGA
jgi:uncharacterized protein (UPF0332 family)